MPFFYVIVCRDAPGEGAPFGDNMTVQNLISQILAALYYNLLATPRVREVQVLVKDPRGMCKADLEFIRRHVSEVHYKPGDSIEDIAYRQGQLDMVRFIENKVIGRRTD